MEVVSAAEPLFSADALLCQISEGFYSLQPGDWCCLRIKARPAPGDLVFASIDADEVIARYQGKSIRLPNGSVRRRWDLIGVLKPIPDRFLGFTRFAVNLQPTERFISQVN